MEKYVIVIDPKDKEIKIGISKPLSKLPPSFLSNENVVKIDKNVSLLKIDSMDISGNRIKRGFFLCLENDIVEIEAGIAFIEFDTKEETLNYFPKIKDMVVWSRV